MRKEIQNDPGCYAELFAQEKCFGKLIERFFGGNDNEFIDTAFLQQSTHVILVEYPNELEAPVSMVLNSSGKVARRIARTNHRYVSNIESAVFFQPQKQDTIRN